MLWLKSFHIITVVTWFAGLFYLPRLFVYHTEVKVDDPSYQRFCTMERKLFWAIMTPSAIITLVMGLGLLHYWMSAISTNAWIHAKLFLVLLLVVYHVMCLKYMKDFAANKNIKSGKFYRIFNEVPAIMLIGIVLLVVLKPF